MFTKNQIQEIGRKLGLFGKKDTDFEDAKLPLSGEEYVVLVQNGKNVKTKVKNLGGNFQPDDPNNPENPDDPSDPDKPDIPDIPFCNLCGFEFSRLVCTTEKDFLTCGNKNKLGGCHLCFP